MSAAIDRLLADLRDHQVQIERHGDRLRMKAPAPPPDALLAQIRARKPELLALLPDADRRPVLHFRLHTHEATAWATIVGRLGETVADLHDDLRRRYGTNLAETRGTHAHDGAPG